MNVVSQLVVVMLLGLLSGCDHDPKPESAQGPWLSSRTLEDDGDILVERVHYLSTGLRIEAQVCRPKREGRFPVLIINHGGFEGLGTDWNSGACVDHARGGRVVAQSAYRGEDGSEGEIEVCLGEVDDVLTLTRLVTQQPYADAERVSMFGLSHGGCITLRAVERGVKLRSAFAGVPPTDFATLHAAWQAGLGAPPDDVAEAVWRELTRVVETATMGTPASRPRAYEERSPAGFIEELAAQNTPLMVLSGTTDLFVPGEQGCELAGKSGAFESYYIVDATGASSARGPAACDAHDVRWQAGSTPPTWPSKRYFMLYEGLGHGFEGAIGRLALRHAVEFLFLHNP